MLRRAALPAPWHLAGALLRYRELSVRERLGAARAARALGQVNPRAPASDRQTLGAWLAAHGQGPRATAALWDLIALPALNLPAAQVSLAPAAFVFQRGLLERADAGDIGFHRRPQSELVGEPAARALRAAGVEVWLGWRAERVSRVDRAFEVWRGGRSATDAEQGERAAPSGGDTVTADAVVLALPRTRAAALLEPLDAATAARAQALRDTPIVNLHVVYDRRVCEQPFIGGVGTPVQYVFDRSGAAGVGVGRQYLAVSQSGADEEMGMSTEQLRERYLPALAELFPRARTARVERFLATREHAATLRAEPGAAALRPGPRTAVPGLLLAGAWTDTGWPATLESAVRSGHTAARCALGTLGVAASADGPGSERAPWPAGAVGGEGAGT